MNKKEARGDAGAVLKKPYFELLINLFFNFVSVRFHLRLFRPLMTNIYITKRCNLRCLYCYPPGPEDDMDPGLGISLLEKIRPKNPAINFTGGEPLLHPHLSLFLKKARALRFYPIVLSTNAYEIKELPGLLPYLDNLIISLDSTEESVNDALDGVPGSTRRIIDNIKTLTALRGKHKFNITLHAVICGRNINGLENLVTFCEELNITLSVSPEHVEVYPHGHLIKNSSYASGIKRLRKLKQEGKPIACSTGYLDKIENFSEHSCFPFFSPRIEPDGTIYFPCYRIREHAFNLNDYESLYLLMREKGQWMTKYSDCRKRCFLACYMEVERYVKNPLSLIGEIPFRNLTLGSKIRLADQKPPVNVRGSNG